MAPVIPLGRLPFFEDLDVACGCPHEQFEDSEVHTWLTVKSSVTLDPQRHFVVRASGDSMNGGSQPISDGALVLCVWETVSQEFELDGKPYLLTGGTAAGRVAMLKVPVRIDGQWFLRSLNPEVADRPVDHGQTLRPVARVLEVVEERSGPVLWGFYDRDAIAGLFGHQNNPSWRVGHRDLDVGDQHHTVLMVNLRKPPGTPIEHNYADRFLSPNALQWESQATTGPEGAKGKRIINQHADGRTIHLFVRYHTKTAKGTGEPYTYCGTLSYQSHDGDRPIQVIFALNSPLPQELWLAWSG